MGAFHGELPEDEIPASTPESRGGGGEFGLAEPWMVMATSPTLDSFVAEVWAPRARRRLAAKTWERDSIVYAKHIGPALGARSIASLDVEDLYR